MTGVFNAQQARESHNPQAKAVFLIDVFKENGLVFYRKKDGLAWRIHLFSQRAVTIHHKKISVAFPESDVLRMKMLLSMESVRPDM